MPHSYEHIVDAQQSSVGDELYNLTQLAEVSIVYFRHHTATIIDGPSAYEKVIKVRAVGSYFARAIWLCGHKIASKVIILYTTHEE